MWLNEGDGIGSFFGWLGRLSGFMNTKLRTLLFRMKYRQVKIQPDSVFPGEESVETELDPVLEAEKAIISKEFDNEYYLNRNPDVAEAGIDPLHHFVVYGWREGRDPSQVFSTSTYLSLHQDVRDAGVNPLWHYIVAGRSEGRALRAKDDSETTHLVHVKSIKEKEVAIAGESLPNISRASLAKILAERTGRNLFISISHDDYTKNIGGVQSCITIESEFCAQRGLEYLHVFPAIPRTWLLPKSAENIIGISINGNLLGFAWANDFLLALTGSTFPSSQLVIHSVLGHSPDWVVALAKLCGDSKPLYWLHDYTMLCPSFALQRNDVASCNGPTLQSAQCTICCYGEERPAHVGRIEEMMSAINPVVVSPSKFALSYVKARSRRVGISKVVEHCKLTNGTKITPRSGPARIGFVGSPVAHKGWRQFAELANEFRDDDRYEFHVFGPRKTDLLNIPTHAVSVTQEGRMAMVDALRREDIDIAILWSKWQETFCLAAYEVVAAGGMIVTSAHSGNITSLVRSKRCGSVFDQFEGVLQAFDSGNILQLVKRRREKATIFDIQFSNMSFDAIEHKDFLI